MNELPGPDGAPVYFRPEDVRLGAEGGLTGTVESLTYLGGTWEVALAAEGRRVLARVPADQTYAKGMEVPFDIARTISF